MEKVEKSLITGDYYVRRGKNPTHSVYKVVGISHSLPDQFKLRVLRKGAFPIIMGSPEYLNHKFRKITKVKAFILLIIGSI